MCFSNERQSRSHLLRLFKNDEKLPLRWPTAPWGSAAADCFAAAAAAFLAAASAALASLACCFAMARLDCLPSIQRSRARMPFGLLASGDPGSTCRNGNHQRCGPSKEQRQYALTNLGCRSEGLQLNTPVRICCKHRGSIAWMQPYGWHTHNHVFQPYPDLLQSVPMSRA